MNTTKTTIYREHDDAHEIHIYSQPGITTPEPSIWLYVFKRGESDLLVRITAPTALMISLRTAITG